MSLTLPQSLFEKPVQVEDAVRPIIMVDDDSDDRRSIERCYRRSGMPNPFKTFAMGQELLSYLEQVKSGEETMPALILLDIRMPQMSGFEVLELIRKQEQFSEVPTIVMLTSSDWDKDVQTARELGADGYQQKPNDVGECVSFFKGLQPAH